MKKQPKISVIFPINNNDKYLRKCIQSVIDSNLKDIELILIDDGSNDTAPAIVDEFARKDNRVIAIHKKNEGSATGRNDGLNIASGEYVAFVESDDYVEPDIYEILYSRAIETKADIVKCGFNYVVNSKKETEYTYFYGVAGEDEVFDIKEHPKMLQFHASIWAGIYKRSFLNLYNLRFLQTPKATYSDFSFMAMTYAYAKRINIVRKALYNYTYDNTASSHIVSGDRFKYKAYHAEEAINILKAAGVFEQTREDFAVEIYKNTAAVAISTPEEERDIVFSKLHNIFTQLIDENFIYREFSNYCVYVIKTILNGDKDNFYDAAFREFLLMEPEKYREKDIVLYGAGRCGRCIEHQLKNIANIILWVDKSTKSNILKVVRPNTILSVQYDCILVAVYKMKLYKEIKKELTEMGVPENKIIWEPSILLKSYI